MSARPVHLIRYVRLARAVSEGISIIVFFAGAMAVGEWIFDKRVLFAIAPMKVNTAFGFLFAAVALWFLQPRRFLGSNIRVVKFCALIVSSVGAATLVAYCGDLVPNIDGIVIPRLPGETGQTVHAGRMSLFAAVNFTIIGIALLIIAGNRVRYRFVHMFLLASGLLSLLTLMGNIYGVSTFFLGLGGDSVCIPTFLFMALSFGLFAVHPDRGFMAIMTSDRIGGTIIRRLLPAAVVCPLLLSWLMFKGEHEGYYNCGFGYSFFSVSIMLVIAIIIYRNALSLDALDRERLRAEENLRHAHDDLEAKVTARTAELRDINKLLRYEIEERKRAEAELRESEKRLRTIVEAAKNVALVISDVGGISTHIIEFSPGAEQIFGYRRQEIIGKRTAMLHLPENIAKLAEDIETMRENKSFVNGEWTLVRRSGERFPALFTTYPIFDNSGSMTQTLSIAVDITERKRFEKDLQNRNELLEKIFSTSYLLIAYLDPRFNYVRVNNAYAVAAGNHPPEYFVGKHHFDVCPDFENEKIFKRVIETNSPYSVAEKPFPFMEKSPGNTTYWDWMLLPIKDAAEKVEGLLVCLIDRTESRFSREKLKRAEKELSDAKRLSDIGTLAATVAHELRNPLAAIKAACYNIERKTGSFPALKSHLSNIDKKVHESDRIINNLLFYSRIKVPQYEKVHLHDLLDETVVQTSEKFHDYNATMVRKYDAIKGMSVMADPVQLKEVFYNILNNAHEALIDKKGAIEVTADYDEGKHEAVICFKDDGVGIGPGNMQKIAEPFFTTKSRGTGLGLTVTYQIINLHGGRIDVVSAEGRGTCFTLRLPVAGENITRAFVDGPSAYA